MKVYLKAKSQNLKTKFNFHRNIDDQSQCWNTSATLRMVQQHLVVMKIGTGNEKNKINDLSVSMRHTLLTAMFVFGPFSGFSVYFLNLTKLVTAPK